MSEKGRYRRQKPISQQEEELPLYDDIDTGDYFEHADDEHIAREKRKARELRASQWWKNELAKGECHYCHGHFPPTELTMDHIIPIIRGGFTKKGNVVPCCKECNNSKKYMLPTEWKESLKASTKEE